MDLKLNIYDRKKVVKTCRAEQYELTFGTCEDLINALQLDKLDTGDNVELVKIATQVVTQSFGVIKPLLKEVFEDDNLTDEELRNTHISEVATCIVEIVKFAMQQIGMGQKSKN